MLVKSPFGRQLTDIAEKLEQSLYCFGGDGGNGSGGSSAQQADMDKELDAIDAEFAAMDAAYDAGESFTSQGVTTDSSDTSDTQEAVRTSTTEPGKTYNFNINRSDSYSVDEQGRRVYDAQLTELDAISKSFEDLDNRINSGLTTVVQEDGSITSQEELMDQRLDLEANIDAQLDAAYQKYPDQTSILYNGNIYVEDPDPFDRFMSETLGPGIGNLIAGQLGGTLLATTVFDVLGAPVGPVSANITYSLGQAGAQGSLFMTPTFQAKAWENPLTGENVVEQRLNIAGELVDRRFTSESEFQAQREKEQELAEKYESGAEQGDATAYVQAATGKRKPSWRDYVNRDFDLESAVFGMVSQGLIDNMTPVQRDAFMLTKNIAEGADPLTALVSIYGDNIDDALGLSELADTAISEIFPEQTAEFLRQNSDLTKLGADIVVYGKDPSVAIRERYGEKILDFMGADSTNTRAAGNAGLNILVNMDRGMDQGEALGKGVIDYFKQGGTVDVLLQSPDTFTSLFEGLESPDIDFSAFDVDFLDLDIPWKETWDIAGKSANELLPVFDVGQLFEFGFELDDFNWEGIDVSGMNLGDFTAKGYNLTDLEGVGIELPDLNIDIPELEFELQLAQLSERIPGEKVTSSGEVIQSLEPDLDFLEDDGMTFSRQVLQRTV